MKIYKELTEFEEATRKGELCLACFNTRTFTHWDEYGDFEAQCPFCVPPSGTPAFKAQQAADLAQKCIATAFNKKVAS